MSDSNWIIEFYDGMVDYEGQSMDWWIVKRKDEVDVLNNFYCESFESAKELKKILEQHNLTTNKQDATDLNRSEKK